MFLAALVVPAALSNTTIAGVSQHQIPNLAMQYMIICG